MLLRLNEFENGNILITSKESSLSMVSKRSKLQPARGTQDSLPVECNLLRYVEETAFKIVSRYGFGEISTPIFENTEVFARTLGNTSDIVTKEMYTFKDRGKDSVTLRPEGTAGVARAIISNGLIQDLPIKLFYRGPMFRYERPQKGRRRQFQQVGIEIIGASEPQADIETISLGHHLLRELGLSSKTTLEINTLGDPGSRAAYREKLVNYLSNYKANLSEDSLVRLTQNPLRILDSKSQKDQEILTEAPLLKNSLNDQSKKFFDEILSGLDQLSIKYKINDRLVRGLDYYTHTAFEFTSTALGAQNTVLAGGRYDGLINKMGGPEISGIGWAAGVERLILLLDHFPSLERPISVIPITKSLTSRALNLAYQLRQNGFNIDFGYDGNLKKRMKRANKVNSYAAILIGEEELSLNNILIRNMDSGEQLEICIDNLEEYLKKNRDRLQ